MTRHKPTPKGDQNPANSQTAVTRIIIARHGNTFGPDDTPTRVGCRTDLPLVEKGLAQGRALGKALAANNLIPDLVFTSELKRTIETAEQALSAMNLDASLHPRHAAQFNEIDYGLDENLPEEDVIARIGEDAIAAWDRDGIPPQGWRVNTDDLRQGWIDFAQSILRRFHGQTALVVTSNGVARFAPVLTGDEEGFKAANDIKIATGAYCVLEHQSGAYWTIKAWNIRPALD